MVKRLKNGVVLESPHIPGVEIATDQVDMPMVDRIPDRVHMGFLMQMGRAAAALTGENKKSGLGGFSIGTVFDREINGAFVAGLRVIGSVTLQSGEIPHEEISL